MNRGRESYTNNSANEYIVQGYQHILHVASFKGRLAPGSDSTKIMGFHFILLENNKIIPFIWAPDGTGYW